VNTATRIAVLGVAVATLALGGCRGAVAAASTGSSPGAVSAADPLGGVESRVDRIERQIDQDGTR
jgi:hypothetical protein